MHHKSFMFGPYGNTDRLITLSDDGLTATVSFGTFAGFIWIDVPVRVLVRMIEESERIQQKNKESAEARELDYERLVDEVRD